MDLCAGGTSEFPQGAVDHLQAPLKIIDLNLNAPMLWSAAMSGDLTHARSLKCGLQRLTDSAIPRQVEISVLENNSQNRWFIHNQRGSGGLMCRHPLAKVWGAGQSSA